tara:strand:- start:146 stop:490 length:345 start_codon:yes stop_codon:yes gene_type:complete
MKGATQEVFMTLQDMIKLATEGKICELELLSLEGGFYILRAQLQETCCTLLDNKGQTMQLRSTTHLRDLLSDLPASAPPLSCVLVQHVVHDEMCGAREGPIEPLRMPFSLTSTW